MVEVACENTNTCNNDEMSFKAYLSRWMAATTTLAPFTTDYVKQKLSVSAMAAVQQCSGGSTGTKCGLRWFRRSAFDGSTGVGQQMAALEVVISNMLFLPQANSAATSEPPPPPAGSSTGSSNVIPSGSQASPLASTQNNTAPVLKGPVTASTGGTSKGNPAAGTVPSTWSGMPAAGPITTAGKAGAVILTIALVSIMSGGAVWINME